MNNDIFNNYLNDNQVIKFRNSNNGGYFLHSETKSVIYFGFFHGDITNSISGTTPKKRIFFNVFNLTNYQGQQSLSELKSKQYFLVNANDPEFAILFKVTINEQMSSIKLSLEKYPKLGKELITDDEKNGIELTLENID